MADDWRTPEAEALFDAFLRLEDRDQAAAFLRDLCTLGELHDLSQRWAVVRLLHEGLHYAEISKRTGASTATITRIASWLHHGEGGYRAMLEKLDRAVAAGDTPYPVRAEG
jgi:TrpR-related protein YerC/YecD